MFLTRPLTVLQGVGTKRKTLFERLLGRRVADALMHLPCDIIHRRQVNSVLEAREGEVIIIAAEVISHRPPLYANKPYAVSCFDGRYFFDIIFFRANVPYIQSILPLKSKRLVTGKLERYQDQWKIVHPDTVTLPENAGQLTGPEPVYPLTAGVTNRCVNRVIKSALEQTPALPEWLDEGKASGWPSWQEAIRQAHAPQTLQDLCPQSPARLRLAYDELLAHQVSLLLNRHGQTSKTEGNPLKGNGQLLAKLKSALPFSLTPGQENAFRDISADMAAGQQMLRLLQGDVGSGKTVVALLAMVQAVEAGFQAALLAPTDILARQHREKLAPLCETLGIHMAVLTGREQGKKRQKILEDLKSGQIHILAGTHALIEAWVDFNRLGLVVIDEQHRFGVEQRLKLMAKGKNPDILSMTATPIPRTLMLASYGDMDVSVIRDKPAGRQPIDTRVLPLSRIEDVVNGAGRALKSGAKIYWVCPLVEESEKLDLAAAVERFDALSQMFPGKVGLVHGKMKPAEKDAVMGQFTNGAVDILVATTVIEVGVDVPAASIMVIEHAERFGLAQLHQLRGRVGRGACAAACLLLYGPALSKVGRQRLEIMRRTNDGFLISEEDLKLRGGGEFMGTKQSGLPRFRIADFAAEPDLYGNLLAMANRDAQEICRNDPGLVTPRGQAVRTLLSLHDRADAARYSRSG